MFERYQRSIKIIGGKVYRPTAFSVSKTVARAQAAKYRRNGYLARIARGTMLIPTTTVHGGKQTHAMVPHRMWIVYVRAKE